MESRLEELRGPLVHPFREVRGGCRDLHVMVGVIKKKIGLAKVSGKCCKNIHKTVIFVGVMEGRGDTKRCDFEVV